MSRLLDHPDALFYIYTGLALGVFVMLSGVYQLLRRSENLQEARSRRMQMMAKGASAAEILAVLKPVERGHWMSRLPFVGDLPKVMRQAGMTGSPTAVFFLCGVLSVVIAAGASLYFTFVQAAAIGLTVGFAVPTSRPR